MTAQHTRWAIDSDIKPINVGWTIIATGNFSTGDGYDKIAEVNHLEHARLIAAAPETAAERDRLKAINAELLAILELISQLQRDKCETATGGMLLMLLEHKVGLARTAIAKATEKPAT